MSNLPYLFAGLALSAGGLAAIAIWSHRSALPRAAAIVSTALFMAFNYAALVESLSRPKPVAFELGLRDAEKARVLAARLAEGKAIYLWLKFEGLLQPRYYEMAWDEKLAEELQEALKQALDGHTGVEMRLPFEPSFEDRVAPRFYPTPQPALPPKDVVPGFEQEGPQRPGQHAT